MVVQLAVTAVAIKSRSASRAGTRGGGDRAPRGIQPEQVDDDRHRERCNADAANDQDPGPLSMTAGFQDPCRWPVKIQPPVRVTSPPTAPAIAPAIDAAQKP